jgi:hypothetical protein
LALIQVPARGLAASLPIFVFVTVLSLSLEDAEETIE